MKKYAFAALVIAATIIVSSAYIHKRLYPVTFYYKIGAPDQRIECGFTTAGPEHSVTSVSYTNIHNWDNLDQSADPNYIVDGSSYVRSFTIDYYESTSDGDDDGQISLAEALIAIDAQFVSNCSYPSTSTTVVVDTNNSGGSATISAFTRSDNANVP